MKKRLVNSLPFGIIVGLILVVVSLLGLYPTSSYWFQVGLAGFAFIFIGIGYLLLQMVRAISPSVKEEGE